MISPVLLGSLELDIRVESRKDYVLPRTRKPADLSGCWLIYYIGPQKIVGEYLAYGTTDKPSFGNYGNIFENMNHPIIYRH